MQGSQLEELEEEDELGQLLDELDELEQSLEDDELELESPQSPHLGAIVVTKRIYLRELVNFDLGDKS